MASINRCGIISAAGTLKGNARNDGKRTVNVGITKIIFELLGLSSNCKSLAFNIPMSIAINIVHSAMMFARLSISIPVP